MYKYIIINNNAISVIDPCRTSNPLIRRGIYRRGCGLFEAYKVQGLFIELIMDGHHL